MDAVIADVSGRQDGVMTTEELVDAGLRKKKLRVAGYSAPSPHQPAGATILKAIGADDSQVRAGPAHVGYPFDRTWPDRIGRVAHVAGRRGIRSE